MPERKLPIIPGLTRTGVPGNVDVDTIPGGLESIAGKVQSGASALIDQAKALLAQAASLSPGLSDMVERVSRILDMASSLESRKGMGTEAGVSPPGGGLESPARSEFLSSPLESMLRR